MPHLCIPSPRKLFLPLRKERGYFGSQTLSSLEDLGVSCIVKVSPVYVLRPHTPSLNMVFSRSWRELHIHDPVCPPVKPREVSTPTHGAQLSGGRGCRDELPFCMSTEPDTCHSPEASGQNTSALRAAGEKACRAVAKDLCSLLFSSSPQTAFLITPTAAMLWLLAINKDYPGTRAALTHLTLNT